MRYSHRSWHHVNTCLTEWLMIQLCNFFIHPMRRRTTFTICQLVMHVCVCLIWWCSINMSNTFQQCENLSSIKCPLIALSGIFTCVRTCITTSQPIQFEMNVRWRSDHVICNQNVESPSGCHLSLNNKNIKTMSFVYGEYVEGRMWAHPSICYWAQIIEMITIMFIRKICHW